MAGGWPGQASHTGNRGCPDEPVLLVWEYDFGECGASAGSEITNLTPDKLRLSGHPIVRETLFTPFAAGKGTSLQLRVLCLGLLQDGDVGVGVLP